MRRRHRRHRSGGRAQFGFEGERIGFERQAYAIGSDDLVFVGPSGADVGNEQFPDAGVAAVAHRVPAAVPFVEIAYDRYTPRIGRPDGEMHARRAFMVDEMGAELVEQPEIETLPSKKPASSRRESSPTSLPVSV